MPKLSYYVVQEIYEASSLSIQENPFNISIYPNPVSEEVLNIINPSNEPLSISIYDVNGRNINSQQIIFDSVDISDLSTGFYSLVIEVERKLQLKR